MKHLNFFIATCFVLLLLPFGHPLIAQQYDYFLTNARVIDGTGNPWFWGNVGVKNGKIAYIGPQTNAAGNVIDVGGKVVAPGFIDVHTHVEGSVTTIPTADNFIHDGVTTIITGNCGSSEVDIAKFLKNVERTGSSVNVGTLIGHNDVREAVMQTAMRSPSPLEQKQMEALVRQGMQDGALGFSTGLIYIPGTYAKTDEVAGMAKAAAAEGGIYVSHIRNEGATVKFAIQEAINIGKIAQMPVQISHFKISAKPLWGQSYETIGMVDAARAEGIDVTIDQYPYTASSTNLGTMLPSWALAGGDSAIHERLTDPATRQKIKEEMIAALHADNRENFDYAVVARYAPDTTFEGKSITQINAMLGRPAGDSTEAELIMDMQDRGFAQMIFHKMSEDDVQFILRYPFTMVASDAGIYAYNRNQPHPRGYGSNARVLGRYVRDFQALKLEDAIRRMTSLPAGRFGINNRGLLKEGYAADIVVFDPDTIQDEATFERPHAYSQGITYVFVNGELTIDNGEHTGALNGQVVKKK